jgi:hypothetical protein
MYSTGDLTVFLEPKAAFATAPAHGGLALSYMCDAARNRPVQAWGPLVSSPKSVGVPPCRGTGT